MHMYVGVDTHKATFSAAVIDEDGSIVREARKLCSFKCLFVICSVE